MHVFIYIFTVDDLRLIIDSVQQDTSFLCHMYNIAYYTRMDTETGLLGRFKRVVADKSKNVFTVQEILDIFGKDCIVFVMCLITFVTTLPLPPWGAGFEAVPGGILCILLSIQGLIGMDNIYVPSYVRRMEIDITFLQKSKSTMDTIEYIESWLNPHRMLYVFNKATEMFMYLLIIANSLLMIIPIVGTNALPSLSITMLTLAWIMNDGIMFSTVYALSICMLLAYLCIFMWFSKYIYKNRRSLSFGLVR